jgi:hypothetical protein
MSIFIVFMYDLGQSTILYCAMRQDSQELAEFAMDCDGEGAGFEPGICSVCNLTH